MPLTRAVPWILFPIVHPGKEQSGCEKVYRGSLTIPGFWTGAASPKRCLPCTVTCRVQGLNSTGNAGQGPMQSGLISTVRHLFRRDPVTGDSLVVSMHLQLLVHLAGEIIRTRMRSEGKGKKSGLYPQVCGPDIVVREEIGCTSFPGDTAVLKDVCPV